MDFDPNTGLPWGTNPFKATSRETYQPALLQSQFHTGVSSNGLDYQFNNLPFSNQPSSGSVYPPAFTTPIDPMLFDPSQSALSWSGSQQEFDFSLFEGGGYGEENKVNTTYNTLLSNPSTAYCSLPQAACFENTADVVMSSQAATIDPINFTTNDLDSFVAQMNRVAMQPPTCVTPPSSKVIKVPSAPKKGKARSGFSQAMIRPFPLSPTTEAVARRQTIQSRKTSGNRGQSIREHRKPEDDTNNKQQMLMNLSQTYGTSNPSLSNSATPSNYRIPPYSPNYTGFKGNSPTPLALRSAFLTNTPFAPTPLSNASVNVNSQAGTCMNQHTQLLPPLPISPLQTSPRSDSSSRAKGTDPPKEAIPSTVLATPLSSAPSQLSEHDVYNRVDDIPVMGNQELASDFSNSLQHVSFLHGFPTDSPQISPKTSVTNFHADLPCSGTLVDSPIADSPRDVPGRKTPQKSKSLNTQISRNRRQTSAITPTSNGKPNNPKTLRHRSLQDSTPSKPNRKSSSHSSSIPSLNAAIFVNFTPRDSKKLLNGVAPSGSSKRKKTLEGYSAATSNIKSTRSTSEGGCKAIKM
ncbi:hypothetical protein PSHT_05175 [Puccinia striiformis]|uniref:Developmental regulatory protein wetA n=1 Tax=Puccinia striiformis TaxID=27350 RepID=A0A2S4WB52_9BASI|nr:hypothetical protein PSHT_05175 [Puccinia striiformis]